MTTADPPGFEEEPSIFDQPDTEADQRATQRGIADADAGRVVPHEEVAEWLKTWGTPDERPAPRSWFR